MEVTPAADDFVRSSKIRKRDGKVQELSIKRLHPLDLSITHSHEVVNPSDGTCCLSLALRD